jgi:hypothetical protein
MTSPRRRYVLSSPQSRVLLPALLVLLSACAAVGDLGLRAAVEHRLRFYDGGSDAYEIVSCRSSFSKDRSLVEVAPEGARTAKGVMVGRCEVRFEMPDYPELGATLRFKRELRYAFDARSERWTEIRSSLVAEGRRGASEG